MENLFSFIETEYSKGKNNLNLPTFAFYDSLLDVWMVFNDKSGCP